MLKKKVLELQDFNSVYQKRAFSGYGGASTAAGLFLRLWISENGLLKQSLR